MTDRQPSGALSDAVSAELIANRGFAVGRRGFDQDEVRGFLSQVASAVRGLNDQIDQLKAQVTEATRAADHPNLDEDTLMRLVGEETASILRTARAAATDMRSKAQSESEELVRQAQEAASEMVAVATAETTELRARAEAEAVRVVDEARQAAGDLRSEAEGLLGRATQEADQAAAKIRASAQESAEQMVERARKEADSLRQQAEHDRKLTVEGAQAVREKILGDLSRRRRVASIQIEQLRAGRERLLNSYAVVRRTLEEVNDELHRADAEARDAAADVGRRHGTGGEVVLFPEELGGEPSPTEPTTGEVPVVAGDGPAVVAAGEIAEEASDAVPPPDLAPGPVVDEAVPAPEEAATVDEATVDETTVDETKVATATVTAVGPAEVTASGAVNPEADTTQTADTTETADTTLTAETVGAETAETAESAVAAGEPGEDTESVMVPTGELTSDHQALADEGLDEDADDDPGEPTGEGVAASTSRGGRNGRLRVLAGATSGAPTRPSSPRPPSNRPRPPAGPPRPGSGSSGPERDGTVPPAAVAPPAVEDLFARIRAGRKSAVTNARQVLQSDSSTGTADPEGLASDVGASGVAPSQIGDPLIDADGELAAADGEAVDGEAADGAVDDEVIDVDLEVVDIVAADAAADDEEEPQHSDEEEAWLQRRDAALADIETSLTRKLKRALQDEQNDLLDRLRSLRGRPNASGLLVTDLEQKQRFSSAASTLVEQAAKEGVTFAVTLLGEQGVKAPQPRSATESGDLVDSLAESIVDPLRRRLEQTITDFADDEQVVLVEALGAAYREWKTQRIEQIAGDVLTAAFARGTVHATPKAARLRWLADDVTGPCSDCDDNVLEGPLPKSEAFPTGQIHPPAHTGCRCILIPGPA